MESAFSLLKPEEREWLAGEDCVPDPPRTPDRGIHSLREGAFSCISWRIIAGIRVKDTAPRRAIRDDEIVWGRAPVRIDLDGGWTDTPLYSLEHGGCVVNAAVDLNAQPPIQVFARKAVLRWQRRHSRFAALRRKGRNQGPASRCKGSWRRLAGSR